MYVEDEQYWELSGILQHKGLSASRKYLVVCAGYDEPEACWLLESKPHNTLEFFKDCKVSHGLN